MFEKIDFDEFFSKTQEYLDSKEEVLAATVITPVQTVHARLVKKSETYSKSDKEIIHKDIFYDVLGKIFDVGCEIDVGNPDGREKKRRELGIAIKNVENNFVMVRYAISEIHFFAIVEMPAFITTYQYNELVKLNEKFKKLGLDIGVIISDYNPVIVEKDKNMSYSIFEEETDTSLDLALDFLERNNRVVDYDLSFGEENVLEYQELALAS